MVRIGHKGAASLVTGNTLESFERAVDVGVDVIELDVLPIEGRGAICAHDAGDVANRECLSLEVVVEAFSRAPLDEVRVNFDMKIPGAERELVEAITRHGTLERAMTSGPHLRTIRRLGELAPGLSRGWTVPRVRRDWSRTWWARPALPLALARGRRQLPGAAREWIPKLGVDRMWVFHRLVSPTLIEAAHESGAELYAWTVDDLTTMRALKEMGVDGICSNDPTLFSELEGARATASRSPAEAES